MATHLPKYFKVQIHFPLISCFSFLHPDGAVKVWGVFLCHSFLRFCFLTKHNEMYLNNSTGKIAVFYVKEKVVPCTRLLLLGTLPKC